MFGKNPYLCIVFSDEYIDMRSFRYIYIIGIIGIVTVFAIVGCTGNGGTMIVGQQTEGLAKIDRDIHQFDGRRKYNELDAIELQQEVDRQKAYKRHVSIVAIFIGLIALTALFLAWYAARQCRKTRLQNRVLARQIKDSFIYKEKYEELANSSLVREETLSPVENSSLSPSPPLASLSPEELFHYIEHEVSRRMLFLNPAFDRQMIMDEFHLSKERVGAAFSQGSKYDSLPQFISDLRLEYASKLLVTTDLPIAEITAKAGFSNASVFSRYFSRKFQISPTQYRRANSELS